MNERSFLKLAKQAIVPSIYSFVTACAPQTPQTAEVIYVVVPPFEESGQLVDQAAGGNTAVVSDGSALSRGPLGGGAPLGEVLPVEAPSEASVDPSLCQEGDSRTEEQTLYINTIPPVGVRARREPGQNAQSDGVVPQATLVTLECLRIFGGQEWFRTRYRIPDGEGGFWVLKNYLAQEPVIPVRPPAPPVISPSAPLQTEPQIPEVETGPDVGSAPSESLTRGANSKEFSPGWAGDNFRAGNSRIRMEAPDSLGPRVIYFGNFVRAERLPFDKWGIVVLVGGQEKKFFIKDPVTANDLDWQKKNGVVYGNDRPTRIRWRTWGSQEPYKYVEFEQDLLESGDVLLLELLEVADINNKVLGFGPELKVISYYRLS